MTIRFSHSIAPIWPGVLNGFWKILNAREEVICVYDSSGQSDEPSFTRVFVKEGLQMEARHIGSIRFRKFRLLWSSTILYLKLFLRPLVMRLRP
ncbi:MAG: hypothetical protein H8E14_07760 [Candidatus Marinimicrobia bacterium]|nr:hypothetical protein [Candidatus Neomarinimicrobiota bacterium]